jgi:hypothetical protein
MSRMGAPMKVSLVHRHAAVQTDAESQQYRDFGMYVRFALFGIWVFYLALVTRHLAPEIPVPSVTGLTYPIGGPS